MKINKHNNTWLDGSITRGAYPSLGWFALKWCWRKFEGSRNLLELSVNRFEASLFFNWRWNYDAKRILPRGYFNSWKKWAIYLPLNTSLQMSNSCMWIRVRLLGLELVLQYSTWVPKRKRWIDWANEVEARDSIAA